MKDSEVQCPSCGEWFEVSPVGPDAYVFSMTRSEAVRMNRESTSDREDYAEVIRALKAGKVKLEEFLSVRTSGDGEIH